MISPGVVPEYHAAQIRPPFDTAMLGTPVQVRFARE
jgi:hypothetical protein